MYDRIMLLSIARIKKLINSQKINIWNIEDINKSTYAIPLYMDNITSKEQLLEKKIDLNKNINHLFYEVVTSKDFLINFKEKHFLLTNKEIFDNYDKNERVIIPIINSKNEAIGIIESFFGSPDKKLLTIKDIEIIYSFFDILKHQIYINMFGKTCSVITKKDTPFDIGKEHNKNILLFAKIAFDESFSIIKNLKSLKIIKSFKENIEDRKKYYKVFERKHKKINLSLKKLHMNIENLKDYCEKEKELIAKDLSVRAGINISPELILSYDTYLENYKDLVGTSLFDDAICTNERVRHYRHQIKTMINGISTNSLFLDLKDELNNNEIELNNEDILEEIDISLERAHKLQRQSKMIKNLRKRRKIFSNSKLINLKPIELMLNRFQKDLKNYKYKIKKFDIDLDYSIDTEQESYFDLIKIEEILQILIENSVEELGEKMIRQPNNSFKPKIFVEIKFIEKRFIVEVSDNGRGVPINIKKNIFDDYYTKGKTQGSGIGLAVVKRYANENGGYVEVYDNQHEETGSLFRVETKI